ncbi:heterokaryon incompatibility protein-domain-containing protein [Apodospora peruviana]|uniref:Heterokaryon incompatibility protein-domain-containing protein n=1 Tax=Apodospora peruviana TaxID=516989 RepID=A0AAE0IUB1_9PEZI|nr:heterokaryon incompatibility protein-domain-containing protein [Apodospora peruviana]
MRLLCTDTLQLKSFLGDLPKYAILSHTWEDEEVTFEDMKPGGSATSMKGYAKLQGSAALARSEGLGYIWIDTCCIDKSSSAELSEAINSMFAWYRDAEKCYAYLADVDEVTSPEGQLSFRASKWFTRGWTLQELIAPLSLDFFGQSWNQLGTRSELGDCVKEITRISEGILLGYSSPDAIPVAVRMSWISNRTTTRPEDIAYCMMGLLNVNMPLVYGEGAEKAFRRLQQEFLKVSEDESLFAWWPPKDESKAKRYWDLLAPSPRYFAAAHQIFFSNRRTGAATHPTEITNRGIRLDLSLYPMEVDESESLYLALLNCNDLEYSGDDSDFTVIILQRLSPLGNSFTRIVPHVHGFLSDEIFHVGGLKNLSEAFKKRRLLNSTPETTKLSEGRIIELGEIGSDAVQMPIFVRSSPEPAPPNRFLIQWGPVQRIHRAKWVSVDDDTERQTGSTAPKYYISPKPSINKVLVGRHRHPPHPNPDHPWNLRKRTVRGWRKLRVTVKDDRTSSDSEIISEDVACLVRFGFEPLPANPFGTVAPYIRPWYGFSDISTEAQIASGDVVDTTPSVMVNNGLLQLSAEFSYGVVASALTYQINFVVH